MYKPSVEDFGEWMNIAHREVRLGREKDAANAAQRALDLYANYPELWPYMTQQLLNVAKSIANNQ